MALSPPNGSPNKMMIEQRLRAALWSFFAGDALSSPTHWFYGGLPQIQQYYGPQGIVDYTKPVFEFPGSILNKSNLSGGGRASSSYRNSQSSSDPPTIIGHVINHGMQDLWSPKKQIHYHATLEAGENTLEAQLARVLMKSIVSCDGVFDQDHFRQAYMDFMQTPGSHRDLYASTCHRMFFANLVYKKLPPEQCPDNDHHNVDTIDGLVLPSIVGLAANSREEAAKHAASCVAVTRNSSLLQRCAAAWGELLHDAVHSDGTSSSTNLLTSLATRMAVQLRLSKPRAGNMMTACYLDSALPALLDNLVKYENKSVWKALLENANTGGENVHRGSCLGAALGALSGSSALEEEPRLFNGLHDREALQKEIEEFVAVVARKQQQEQCSAT